MYLDGQFTRDDEDHLSGVIGHGNVFPDLRQLSVYGKPGQEVKLLDGVFLAARSEVLAEKELQFDPRFDFHFYDMDFCRTARERGLKLGTWPIALTHQSGGSPSQGPWLEAYKIYLAKWGS